MELIKKFIINTQSSLLFCKIEIKNILKREKPEYDFFTFAVMELGTNILKYAKDGEIWLLKEDGEYLLCALDRGSGIKNLKWAFEKGNTTSKNSLGLGLYQLSNNGVFDFYVYTSTSNTLHGSVFLLKPKHLDKKSVYLLRNFMDLDVGGDYIIEKGKYVILGDAGGHGVKAYKTAVFVKEFMQKNIISCVTVQDVLKKLHTELKARSLRGTVLSVIRTEDNKLDVCGVGNIGMMYKNDTLKLLTQKEGIVGEVYSKMSEYEIVLKKKGVFLSFSDGIDEKVLYNILQECDNVFLLAIAAVFFSDRNDDKIIFAYKG